MSDIDTATISPDRAPVTSLADELVRLEVEDALMQVEGVDSARIVAGDKRIVDELHALVSLDRDPKHVARDLQTLLLTRFGIECDRRVISVVRLGNKVAEDLALAFPRLELECVNVSLRATDTSVSVELCDPDGETVIGSAGPIPGDAVVQAAALATADALTSQLQGGSVRVIDARIIDAAEHRVVVTTLEVATTRSRDILTGSALVRRTDADSVARAVLDATNRLR